MDVKEVLTSLGWVRVGRKATANRGRGFAPLKHPFLIKD